MKYSKIEFKQIDKPQYILLHISYNLQISIEIEAAKYRHLFFKNG